MSTIQEFNFTLNLLQCVIWQYNEAVRLQSLINSKNSWYNANYTDFLTSWVANVFNLITANNFGLSVWAIILNLPLFIESGVDPVDKDIFGFDEIPSVSGYFNFENGNFSDDGSDTVFTTEQARVLLRMRYFQLVSNGSCFFTNFALSVVFQNYGTVFVIDNFDMTMTVVFLFDIESILLEALQVYDLIPRPSGVLLRYEVWPFPVFGFDEIPSVNDNLNFENAGFLPYS